MVAAKTSAPAWAVFEKRGLKQRGENYDTKCPAHDDDHQSLSVSIGEGGKIIMRCFAGCSVVDICAAINIPMSFLWPPQDKKKKDEKKARVIAEYDYVDENGEILYQVQRTDPKGFYQRRRIGTGWKYELGDVRRVLYRLPEIIAQPTRPVIIVEGEKDVDNLRKIGMLATTCAGGAGGWRPHYAEMLKGRTCLNFPDNDDAGEEFAAIIHTWIPDLLSIRLPGLPEKGDVSDWIAAGGTATELGDIARAACRVKLERFSNVLRAIGGTCTLQF